VQVPFNIPYVHGDELDNIADAIHHRKLSGDGKYTKLCQDNLDVQLGVGRSFLTTSCTDALEAAAILARIAPGDEVIMPSYTFVSTANAFALRGARLRFADSGNKNPNMDVNHVASLVSSRTKAICVVHYAGVAVDMDPIMAIAKRYNLKVIEDAAQGIAAQYKGRPLGTIGELSAFSFHETKNINSGEGGALHVNDPDLVARAEIIREKGTNRSAFFRGEIDKYNWVDIGSSFLPSELIAAFLYAQLENIDKIQNKRHLIWNTYDQVLRPFARGGDFSTPDIPQWAGHNAHMYYLVVDSLSTRTEFIQHLREHGASPAFHYQPLHQSEFFTRTNACSELPQATRYGDCLIRLPLFNDLEPSIAERIGEICLDFFVGR
jgi:dTDP-4-amino-4,6-dideoxygalactose transaminase